MTCVPSSCDPYSCTLPNTTILDSSTIIVWNCGHCVIITMSGHKIHFSCVWSSIMIILMMYGGYISAVSVIN